MIEPDRRLVKRNVVSGTPDNLASWLFKTLPNSVRRFSTALKSTVNRISALRGWDSTWLQDFPDHVKRTWSKTAKVPGSVPSLLNVTLPGWPAKKGRAARKVHCPPLTV